ncbi:MAG: hypothetical protein J0I12_14060 [Candidatus Eremiobacteraeota bacterium]|nr:hypothetical protein [Candidatus Eremiobacteraeota bacterium]
MQQFPCSEALGSFLRQHLSTFLVDLLEAESCRLIALGCATCRNGYQQEQQLRLACGALSLRRPRLRGAQQAPGEFLKLMRSRKSFHHVPYLFLSGLARREMGELRTYLQVDPDLWRSAEEPFWPRLDGWRAANLSSLVQHCLVLERLDFGPDHPQLLVALTIDREGTAQVLDARPGDAASSREWSELCHSLKERALPAPILVKGAAEVARSHWPQATPLEVS